jgi:Ca-activated chloride channel homolog
MKTQIKTITTGFIAFFLMMLSSEAAGTLKPKNSQFQAIQITDHSVNVVINNGFAKTEVNQTFHNPNNSVLEAVYSFPLPKSASLSECSIFIGEKEIKGEVLPKKDAEQIYEEEKKNGNDAGLARKNEFYAFEFSVANIPASGNARIRFVYYQPLVIDTGVGRYLYPLEDGGTDDKGLVFWETNRKVENQFDFKLELKSACPVASVRIPDYENAAKIESPDENHSTVHISQQGTSLEKDIIFYFKLKDNLPGRIEVIPYKAAKEKQGTFMLVATPGLDLKELTQGSDYTFILDVSGSMEGKIYTLVKAVEKSIEKMIPADRYRIVIFNNQASWFIPDFTSATPENVKDTFTKLELLRATGSTNMYDGLRLGLDKLDADRVQTIILVTDGVTNTGEISPKAFYQLMKKQDIRVFGFLMGNSCNWPLMESICNASGGFSAGVSNNDDIIGQILLAKSKIRYECLHDATLKISGIKVTDTSDELLGKVYRGQQLVMFGRYEKAGKAKVTLNAKLSGQDQTYSTEFDFPEVDTDNPELERLWALNQIEILKAKEDRGLSDSKEMEAAIRGLGVEYQIVTDYTSMVVLSDETFSNRKIERKNAARIAIENNAASVRNAQPIRNYQVDTKAPAFHLPVPTLGGGGAFGGLPSILLCLGSLFIMISMRKK